MKKISQSFAAAAVLGAFALAGPSSALADDGCGLSASVNAPYTYTIKQCNGNTIYRKVIKSNGTYGSCRKILGYSSVSGSSAYRITGYTDCPASEYTGG